jgi:hypothetical protein
MNIGVARCPIGGTASSSYKRAGLMIRLLHTALISLLALCAPAQAQQPASQGKPGDPWLIGQTKVASRGARIAFPRVAGPVALAGTRELSNPGQSIDTSLQYRSADETVVATIYLYLPGLSHPGLAAYATERGIRRNSETPVTATRSAVVPAGKAANAALRIDFSNYMGANASSAAFLKAGRWTIKIRVTGPQPRAAEVSAAMSALLDGIEFGPPSPAYAAVPLRVQDCPAGTGTRDARLLPDPAGPELAAHGFLATLDGGGMKATDKSGVVVELPSRLPSELCLSNPTGVREGRIPLLRSTEGPAPSIDGRTRLVAVISDSGTWLEVVHAANLGRYLILYHQIGSTALLGGYDGVPSDRQIFDLLAKPEGDASRIRVPVTFRSDQKPQMHLPALPAEKPSPTT